MKAWTQKIRRGLSDNVVDASEPVRIGPGKDNGLVSLTLFQEEESLSALGLFVLYSPSELQGSGFAPEVE